MAFNALTSEKPNAVCMPFPAQGHINPMLKLAKLLHFKGFHITFVNTEFIHKRLLKSQGPNSLNDLPTFRFETIPDGLPPADANVAAQHMPSLCQSIRKHCLQPLRGLLSKLNSSPNSPPVTCVVSDGIMNFSLDAAQELGIPGVIFWTTSACAFMGYIQYGPLIQKGLVPLKDASYLANGYLDTVIPSIYCIGPLYLQLDHIPADNELKSIGSNLWTEETECLQWLDSKEPNSVVYVNFGSSTVMTSEQLTEFAWGLANSNKAFFWVIRPDLVGEGKSVVVAPEFVEETKGRGLLASWCPQEQVLSHPAIGGFLTHSGWNSTIESVGGGVPMICWPFNADQQTNCRYCCSEWGIGLEIEGDVKRYYIEGLVRKLMEGEEGKKLRKIALEWKKLAKEATTGSNGSSFLDLDQMVNRVLLSPRN
ncbi:7-deoxyloganetin glucosyltransferase-like isoform X3 [Prunus avium]|uniref:Glycosyltransferase n=1 Tax=Prunus avium TaxID=42229 RepID=A0A6P5SUL8_PRUAV|nr:7-deoxyloganetin glucosyltransferase-like isoform X3 [Prunus avium]